MKKITSVLLLFCVVLFSACAADTVSFEDIGKLKLSDDFRSVSAPEQASIYRVSSWAADEQKLCSTLFKRPFTDEAIQGEGPWFGVRLPGDPEGTFQETLCTLDGGKAFEGGDGPLFGFDYMDFRSKTGDLYSLFSRFLSDQFRLEELKQYAESKDLSFGSRDSALAELRRQMDEIGLPELQCVFAEGFTTVRLQALEAAEHLWNDNDEGKPSFTEDYDCYLFVFRQTVDGVSTGGAAWQVYPDYFDEETVNRCYEQVIYAIYTRDGLAAFSANRPLVIGDAVGVYDVLSAQEAIQTVVEQYQSKTCDAELIAAEFCYVIVFDKEDRAKLLQPCWQYSVLESRLVGMSADSKEILDLQYVTYRVNALTGEFASMDRSIDITA